MVSGVTQLMDQAIWHPDAFLKDFGDIKNDLINCLTGNTVPNQPMKKFWEGFERLTKRLKDDKGQPMLLKLKVTYTFLSFNFVILILTCSTSRVGLATRR